VAQYYYKKMKTLLLTLALAAATTAMADNKQKSNGYPITQVPFTQVKINQQSFWGQRLKAARDVTVPLAFSKCETENRYENFKKAAHPSDDNKCTIFPFDDTDVYKTIEGASYLLQTYPDKRLTQYIDSVLDIVAAAQEPDGYLYTPRTMNPKHPHDWSGDKRWVKEEVLSHELYNLGHMVDAACAHYQATGSRKFLDIAEKYANCVLREVGPKAGQACVVPGHQIAEMALARLYVLTGKREYLDEAKFFLDYRGKTQIKDLYSQSLQPVVDQKEAVGHAVRAGYMYAGMADVAALTGDSAYIKAIDAIYDNIVSKKYYLTGGVGARHAGEAFGSNYELPNLTAYNETCAAISMVYLFQRMFLLHGEAKYIDCLERTLYNGVISGMSIDGGRFFYPNPLSADGKYRFNSDNTIERQPWFGCACCPSNLCRFIPSVPGYIYAVKDNDLYVNLFTSNTSTIEVAGKKVTLEETTEYPWNGDIALKVAANKAGAFRMLIRIPGWVENEVVPSDLYSFEDGVKPSYTITVNDNATDGKLLDNGYFAIDRKWKKGDVVSIHFDMDVRTVVANEKVKDDAGRVAVERGPLVYCAEFADNDCDIFKFIMPRSPKFTLGTLNSSLLTPHSSLNGITTISTNGQAIETEADGSIKVKEARLTLIPYYAWNHRGVGKMAVWLNQGVERLDY